MTIPPHPHGWNLQHTYREQLPEWFYEETPPTPVRNPALVIFNPVLASQLGLDHDALQQPSAVPLFSGNALPPGGRWLAQAYAGHQFGHFTILGDGRALLMGEQRAPDGILRDIQLKGSGRTPYSRGGDGRAALGPMLREFLISEAIHALGIPTTRSLAVVTTGETIQRDRPLPGAILTRVAASHIRVGTFQWAVLSRDPMHLRQLLSYSIHRHYPELADSPAEAQPLRFLESVLDRQASLVAHWMRIGFIHGVMNTDNMAISGETIDYGPCAFMDTYHPHTVFSSIDHHGRYAYSNQPAIALWNLARLAESLIPLLPPPTESAIEKLSTTLRSWESIWNRHWNRIWRSKLGLFNEETGDNDLWQRLLDLMQEEKLDWTNTFRDLTRRIPAPAGSRLAHWQSSWQNRLSRQPQSTAEVTVLMQRHNPAFIPRNHKVEEALAAAAQGDTAPFHHLLEIIRQPYNYELSRDEYATPDPTGGAGYQTFCGT